MSVNITNFDMFEELFKYIKNPEVSLDNAIKEFGGSSFYIPSYKSTYRNAKIIEEYSKSPTKQTIKKLVKKYSLSETQLYAITKCVREPTLF